MDRYRNSFKLPKVRLAVTPSLVYAVYGSRAYHNEGHLQHLWTHISLLPHSIPEDILALAIIFHDWLLQQKHPEKASASMALAHTPHLSSDERELLSNLILATAHTEVDPSTLSENQKFFKDADLAILAAPTTEYAQYLRNVQHEYKISPEAWKQGRAAFIKQLLSQPTLFHSREGASLWEKPARHNLNSELSLYPL